VVQPNPAAVTVLPDSGARGSEPKAVLRFGEGRDWWDVRETGVFNLDLALGEKLATEFLRYGRQRGRPSVLPNVIDSMIAKGPDYCRVVRMGFLSVICDLMPEGYDIDYESKQIVLLR
jgi:hypothetical protein